MEQKDFLEQGEKVIHELHEATRRRLHPAHRKYPFLFLFLITFSVVALIHGFDRVLDRVDFFESNPQVLIVIGLMGLFLTGSLYKRLGKDKYE